MKFQGTAYKLGDTVTPSEKIANENAAENENELVTFLKKGSGGIRLKVRRRT